MLAVMPWPRVSNLALQRYGNYDITVVIESGQVSGEFPRRALAHVQEWRQAHVAELREDWELATLRKPLQRIAPLE